MPEITSITFFFSKKRCYVNKSQEESNPIPKSNIESFFCQKSILGSSIE